MRNSLQPYEALSEVIDIITKYDPDESYETYLEINKDVFDTDIGINFDPIVRTISLSLLGCVSYAYTRGDSLDEIDTNLIQVGVKRLLKACDEINRRDRQGKVFFWGGIGKTLNRSDVLSILTLMSWFQCFDIDKEYISKIIPFITPEGVDPLVDTILKRYQPGRIIGHNNPVDTYYPVFKHWHDIGNTQGEGQITLIQVYLDEWAKLLSIPAPGKGEMNGISSLGLILTERHKSNKTLPKDIEGKKYPSYNGHWAWEVALFVKFFNIDDSSFRDNPLYPVEMVDYKK